MDLQDPTLLATLHRMQEGITTMAQALGSLLEQHAAPPSATPPPDLGTAQHQFMVLLCNTAEYTYEHIAYLMGVKLSTVHTHRRRLFIRFGVKSKVGLVQLGRSWGLG